MPQPTIERLAPFIDGARVESCADTQQIRNPYSGEPAHEIGLAGSAEVERAIASSVAAFETTRLLSRAARSEMLARAAQAIGESAETIARSITLEAGKPITLARAEVARCVTTFTLAAEEAKRFTGELVPADIARAYEGYRVLYEPFPVGPVLGITPFNFPLNLVAHKVAPALAAGNSVLVKPAPQAPAAALKLAEIVHAAGAPSGALNVVPCPNDLAERMVRDERLKMLSFTGSARAGWHLKSVAGKKRVTLELGGNAAMIVEDDADLERAAKKAAVGGFAYAGQVCIAVQRIFVRDNVLPDFLARLVRETESLGVGDPTDDKTLVGPLIDGGAADRVDAWVEEAVRAGARLHTERRRSGNVISPIVLTDVDPKMRVACEEVFGPVVVVEPYTELADAIARVNDSAFGLQAGLFTRDFGKIDYAYRNLEVGGLLVNETSMLRIDNYPYGGVKDSGLGREGVRYAMESMSDPRVLVLAPLSAVPT